MRDGRAEQRHYAVAGQLVDDAFKPLDPLSKDRKEALYDLGSGLQIESLGWNHRALHVHEQNRYLLPLLLDRHFRTQNFVGEMPRRVNMGHDFRAAGFYNGSSGPEGFILRKRNDVAAPQRHPLNLDELLDAGAIKVGLSHQAGDGDPPLLTQEQLRSRYVVVEAHRGTTVRVAYLPS